MSIKEIIEATGSIKTVYEGKGLFGNWSCKYNLPATNDEIRQFENNVAILPNDYKEFLNITNGMKFFNSSDFSLYSLNEVIETWEIMGFKLGIYPIGYILEDYIVIKCDEISTGKYIYAGDSYCSDEYFSLNCNFETFLDRYIMSNANNYWRWQTPCEKFDFIA